MDKYRFLNRELYPLYTKLYDKTMDQLHCLFETYMLWYELPETNFRVETPDYALYDPNVRLQTLQHIIDTSILLCGICVFLEKACPHHRRRTAKICLRMHKKITYGTLVNCFKTYSCLSSETASAIVKLKNDFSLLTLSFRSLANTLQPT